MQTWPRSGTGVVAVLVLVAACAGPGSDQSPSGIGAESPTHEPPTAVVTEPSPGLTPIAASSHEPPPTPSQPPSDAWHPSGSMLRAREAFRAVVLGDGTVLAVGDVECHPDFQPGGETAERFDPAIDRWTEAESLNKPRNGNDMVRTGDGEAMVVGGLNADGDPFSSTKLFDPTSGRWRDGPLLDRGRADPVAGVTPDGHIVVASSEYTGETSQTSTVEVLAPGSDGWQAGAPLEGMGIDRFVPLIGGGMVAMGTDFESPTWLLLDRSGTGRSWEEIASPGFWSITHLIALPDGGLLATGTVPSEFGESATSVPRRFDPDSGEWRETARMSMGRSTAQVTTLADGRILFAGGLGIDGDLDFGVQATTEIYDPVADRWSPGPPLLSPRNHGLARTLEDDSVLVMGGYASEETDPETGCLDPLTTVERWYP